MRELLMYSAAPNEFEGEIRGGREENEIKKTIRKRRAAFDALNDLWKKDRVSFRHSIELAKLAVHICDELHDSIGPNEREDFISAALGHDVGKINVDSEILEKPGELTEEEREKMKKHVRDGFRYLKERGADAESEIEIRHHEAAQGHPRNPEHEKRKTNIVVDLERRRGDRRNEKPEFDKWGRILSIIDIFESTANKERPYFNKKNETLAEKRQVLTKFDSDLEKRVIKMLEQREKEKEAERKKVIAL